MFLEEIFGQDIFGKKNGIQLKKKAAKLPSMQRANKRNHLGLDVRKPVFGGL